MTACIQPVIIANDDGSSPTSAPSFAQVVAIWGKCCIDYSVRAPKTVKKTAYKVLEESASNTPSAEEQSLFADAGASSCIQVFVPQTFSQAGVTGKQISGGGGTYDGGTANPKIVVVEGAVSEVVAHEVGHAAGAAAHDANNTVMKPTGAYDAPNSTAVSTDVCTHARSGSVLAKSGAAKDCCYKVGGGLSGAEKAGIGVVGGALVGAGIGALAGGPVGALVGAGIGALVGGIGSLFF